MQVCTIHMCSYQECWYRLVHNHHCYWNTRQYLVVAYLNGTETYKLTIARESISIQLISRVTSTCVVTRSVATLDMSWMEMDSLAMVFFNGSTHYWHKCIECTDGTDKPTGTSEPTGTDVFTCDEGYKMQIDSSGQECEGIFIQCLVCSQII